MTEPSGVVSVYAASGRLGRLIVGELAARNAIVRLGGRDPHKLRALAATLQGNSDWRAAQSDDIPALCEFTRGSRVVINAGPASRTGDSLIRAALQERVHYVDGAGEQSHIRRIFDEHGHEAASQGVALVPSCGFDYALGDCLARILARESKHVQEVTVAYAIAGSEVAANSLQFASETKGGGEVLFEAGQWRRTRPEIFQRTVVFPPPFGRQLMARYAAGEVITVPRHTRTERVTALITVASLVPNPRLVPLFPYLRPAVALIRRTPARRLLALASRLRPASPPDATPPDPPRFAIVVEVADLDASLRRGIIEGGDFHTVTAATLAFAACTVASSTFDKRGALSPAMAVTPEALLDNLKAAGVTWRIEHTDTRRRTL